MNSNFTMIDNDVFRSGVLSVYEISVYGYLLSRQGGNVHTWPSHARIAKDLNIGEKTVRLTIAKLIEKKLILKANRFGADGRRTSNSYVVAKSLPRSLRPTPSVRRTDKEDSVKEKPNKTSSKMTRRTWSDMSQIDPPTERQLGYLEDLQEQLGLGDDDFESACGVDRVRSKADANEAIRNLYLLLYRTERYGS